MPCMAAVTLFVVIGMGLLVVGKTTTSPSSSLANAFASADASGSWWEGAAFEDDENNGGGGRGRQGNNGGPSPLLQVPCGLMVTVTAGPSADDDGDMAVVVLPLTTVMVDTGLRSSTLHRRALDRYPQLRPLLVARVTDPGGGNKEYADDGKHEYEYEHDSIIPPGRLWLRMGSVEATVRAPALRIVGRLGDDDGNDVDENEDEATAAVAADLRLGMDFLRTHHAVIDVGSGEMLLQLASTPPNRPGNDDDGHDDVIVVTVPFILPRGRVDWDGDDDGDGEGPRREQRDVDGTDEL